MDLRHSVYDPCCWPQGKSLLCLWPEPPARPHHLFYMVLQLLPHIILEQDLPQHSPQVVYVVPQLDNVECDRRLYLALFLPVRCPCVMKIQSLKQINVLLLNIFFLLKKPLFLPPSPAVVRAVPRKSFKILSLPASHCNISLWVLLTYEEE